MCHGDSNRLDPGWVVMWRRSRGRSRSCWRNQNSPTWRSENLSLIPMDAAAGDAKDLSFIKRYY